MSDLIKGIKSILPTYPVKPIQPGSKDRKSDKRKKDQPIPDNADERGDDDKPSIDEYV